MQSTASSNVTLRTEGAVASFVTLKTGEMNKTFSQFMNRWMCSLVALSVSRLLQERIALAGLHAHLPLEAKLRLKEKLISPFLYFPHAPKGTMTTVLLSSVPNCIA